MIFVYYGHDVLRRQAAVEKRLAAHHSHMRFDIDGGSGAAVRLEELVSSNSFFFSERYRIVCFGVLSTATARDEIFPLIETLEASPHCIVFVEDKIDVETKKRLARATKRIWEFASPENNSNLFAFADLVARGDRKGAWVQYMIMLEEGKSAEDLIPVIAWKLRTELARTRAGVAARKRLERLSRDLTQVHWRSRTGDENRIDLALERYILTA